MKHSIPTFLTIFLLAACSGGGGSNDATSTSPPTTTVNTAPDVEAGVNQSVTKGTTVQLDASVTDAQGDSVTLAWSLVSGPDISLSASDILNPTFVAPDVAADTPLLLRLTADDGVNAAVSDEVTITIIDTALTAEAGHGRIVTGGHAVTLEATATGGTIGWAQLMGPTVTLAGADTQTPSFTAPQVASTQSLIFELTVTADTGETATDQVNVEIWVAADSSNDLTVTGDFSTFDDWACDQPPAASPTVTFSNMGTMITVESNAIPNHATGTFPNAGNPNQISTQNKQYAFSSTPTQASTITQMAEFGVTIDGVKLERDTAESYQNQGQWRYEAVTPGLADGLTNASALQWLGTDCNNAHVQPTGEYHYHGMMESLINREGEQTGTATDMILGGYAADGFPFYLRYGYSNPTDASSALTAMQGSWAVKSGTRAGGPGSAYDGTFREDWEYVENSGDLDECNGRVGVTPQHPEGIYHYYITDDYPYIPRCVRGTPDSTFRQMR